jgi:hypothetical protein
MTEPAILATNIDIIMRQTNYTEEEASNKLKEYKDNVETVIREYITGDAVKRAAALQKPTTFNQQIYYEIRTMMDEAAKEYKMKKEKEGKDN